MSVQSSELDIGAARLAWVMLQFAQASLPPAIRHMPELGGSLGTSGVRFFPTGMVVPLDEVSATLLSLPKPLAVGAMSARGLLAIWMMESLIGETRRAILEEMRQNAAWLQDTRRSRSLTEETRILLRYEGVEHIFTFAVLERLVRDYHVYVGWVLQPHDDPSLAPVFMQLVGPDGRHS
jgi:hypothetical protein